MVEEPSEAETTDEIPAQQVGVGSLLAYIDMLLSSLPNIDAEQLAEPDGTTLSIEGSPEEVRGVVRSMMGFAHPGHISLKLTLDREEWQVSLTAR